MRAAGGPVLEDGCRVALPGDRRTRVRPAPLVPKGCSADLEMQVSWLPDQGSPRLLSHLVRNGDCGSLPGYSGGTAPD